MSRFLLTFVCFLFFGAAAFGQATLRVGDPIELKIGGVPAEEQAQVNNIYTVDANGSWSTFLTSIRSGRRALTPAQLAASIEATYRANKIYTNPTITIVMQPQSRFVNVGGAVRSPTRVAIY